MEDDETVMGKANEPKDVFKRVDMAGRAISECWPFKGKVNAKDQRPYFTVKGVRRPAYVIVYECYTGEPADGRQVLHSCDNGEAPVACCNPHHLSWGTHQDNMNDMKERDRHGLPKIAHRAIVKLLVSGNQTHAEIANLYGISREAVTAINNNRSKQV